MDGSEQTVTDNVTCDGEVPFNVSITLIIIWPIFSVGNSLTGSDVGGPCSVVELVPNSG